MLKEIKEGQEREEKTLEASCGSEVWARCHESGFLGSLLYYRTQRHDRGGGHAKASLLTVVEK